MSDRTGREVSRSALVAALATTAVAPAVRRAMIRRDVIDTPNHRSSHTVPIPRGGGLATLVGVACAAAATKPADLPFRALAGAGALAALGFADDRRGGLDASVRLVSQIGLGGASATTPAGVIAGGTLTPAVVNVVNFMDGINGITGSTMLVWGWHAAANPNLDYATRWLAGVTAGAAAGFLPWNAPRARLFLGDVGSYFFGGLTAAALTRQPNLSSVVTVGAPLLAYAADAAQALVAGYHSGVPLFEAHRRHIYQQLVDRHGLTHVQTSALHAGLAATLGLAFRRLPLGPASAAGAALVGVYLATPIVIDHLRGTRR